MVTMGEWWAEQRQKHAHGAKPGRPEGHGVGDSAEQGLDASRESASALASHPRGPDPGLRPDTTGYWCMVASTEGHQHCKRKPCDCPCHLPANRSGDPKRPHSYPREDWRRLPMSRRRDLARQRR